MPMSKVRVRGNGQQGTCAICEQFGAIEYDHPFRDVNDPDYTIPLCCISSISCHRIVTRMDNVTGVDPTAPYAPFVFILHRMRLAFIRHGFPEIAEMIRSVENCVLNINDAESHRYRKNRNRRNLAPHPGTDSTVLVLNIASWAKRAAELAQTRLPVMQEPEAQADYQTSMRVIAEIISDPAAFCNWLIWFMDSAEGQMIASQALAFFTTARIKVPDAPELMKVWRNSASVIPKRVNR
jgi:hypothetical protein